MRSWLYPAIALVALPILGCSSSDSDGDVGPIDQACLEVATNRCEVLDRCAPAYVQLAFGSRASCTSQFEAWCNHVGSLPSSKIGPKALTACASSYSGMSCDTWQSRRDDALCGVSAGSLQEGSSCVSGYQCASKACFIQGDTGCGSCQKAPNVGEGCRLSIECPSNTSCIGYKCLETKGIGQACDASNPCGGTLLCTSGTCVMSPAPGQPCLDGICDNKLGTVCKNEICEAFPMVDEGQPCDGTAGPYCRGGPCIQAVCKAQVPEGRPCSTNAGCSMPSICIQGWCKVPDPSTCP